MNEAEDMEGLGLKFEACLADPDTRHALALTRIARIRELFEAPSTPQQFIIAFKKFKKL